MKNRISLTIGALVAGVYLCSTPGFAVIDEMSIDQFNTRYIRTWNSQMDAYYEYRDRPLTYVTGIRDGETGFIMQMNGIRVLLDESGIFSAFTHERNELIPSMRYITTDIPALVKADVKATFKSELAEVWDADENVRHFIGGTIIDNGLLIDILSLVKQLQANPRT